MEQQQQYTDLRKVPDAVFQEKVNEMMATEGWHLFCSEIWATSEHLNDLQTISNMEELCYTRGKLDHIGFVLNYKQFMESAEENSNESP